MEIREEMRSMVPPNSVEAEISVLGSMLQDNAALLRAVEQLTPEDFYQPEHREIFKVMAVMNRQQLSIDLVTVQNIWGFNLDDNIPRSLLHSFMENHSLR